LRLSIGCFSQRQSSQSPTASRKRDPWHHKQFEIRVGSLLPEQDGRVPALFRGPFGAVFSIQARSHEPLRSCKYVASLATRFASVMASGGNNATLFLDTKLIAPTS
jgi:hypothetical protein